DTLTYLAGDHVVKGGAEYNDTSIDQVFKGNWRGVYIFNNQADFLAGRWSQYRQFAGLNGLTADQAGRANFRPNELALFPQHKWFVRPNLAASFGLRQESRDTPTARVLTPNARTADGTFKLSAHIPDTNPQLPPRLGISWAPDEKTALRFSAGRFWSR